MAVEVILMSPTVPVAVADAGAVAIPFTSLMSPQIPVVTVELLPNTVVFEPKPTALFPITVWFV
jgi:hypothetical protein